MSTFKEKYTGKTITIENGNSLNYTLLQTHFGVFISAPVYFGMRDSEGNNAGNLSNIPKTEFYLISDTNGCTARVETSAGTGTSSDDNTARRIYLSIPSTTSSRLITFKYNGTVLFKVQQNVSTKTTYNLYIVEPYRTSITSDDISSPVYYLTMDNIYNEEYIARSEGNNVNIQTSNFTNYLILILDVDMSTFNPGFNLLSGTMTLKYLINNYNLTHVMGDTYNDSDMGYDNYICSFARGMYDSEQDIYINNLYQKTSYNGSIIYVWNPANLSIHSDTFILAGEFSLVGSSSNFRLGQYTIEF